ncbi:MAG: DNA polymerase III subunit delta', partial [Planctomycetota bacterium]|nr:DNA polymerase III subunit delta' [Planctomycetota bacterium]
MSVEQASAWSQLRGHQGQREHFQAVLAAGRLGHAYLLVGPEGIGKRRFAHCLAACLLCPNTDPELLEACNTCPSCKQIAAGSHPDLLEVGLPEGKNVVPISLLVGDRDSRGRAGLCYQLSLSPMESTRRVAILDSADHLERDGYSALLKTLEEPPPHSVMILIAGSEADIRDTIRSRCQLVRFSTLQTSDVADLLVETEATGDRAAAEEAAELADGSMVTAMLMLNPERRTLREALFRHL